MAIGTLETERVREALEDPRYNWRTIAGIARQTNLDEEAVKAALAKLGDEVVRSGLPSPEGADLYTTRHQYRLRQPIWRRFLAALKNRAD